MITGVVGWNCPAAGAVKMRDGVMKSRSRGVKELKSRTAQDKNRLHASSSVRHPAVDSSTPNFYERSGNVYENKGRGQTSLGLAQTLPLNVCDAPKAQAGQIAPLALNVPSGHRRVENVIFISFRGPKAHGDRPQTSGVCAIRRSRNCRNKARMSMKTKERLRNQPPLAPPYPRRGISWLIAEG